MNYEGSVQAEVLHTHTHTLPPFINMEAASFL